MKQLKFKLVNDDELEKKAQQWILKFYKKVPLFIYDITLNSKEQWSVSYPDKITLGLQWNRTPQDVMCLWIHEQLHAWDKTRDPAWLEYVKEKYSNRDMDKAMNQFANGDIDSCFAQHLVVIWNAFNITKHFYPGYVKDDVAYVKLQQYIRDNDQKIKNDLEKFGLVIENKALSGGERIKKEEKEKIQNPEIKKEEKGTIEKPEKIGNEEGKGYVCKCAFSRNKGVTDYTCLVDNEIKQLQNILQQPSKDLYQFYQQLIENYQCSRSSSGVDQCVRDNLVDKYGGQVENAFHNALPLKDQIQQLQQWLSSSNIDLLSQQLENNHPNFKYMGIQTWDAFEDQKKQHNTLNPEVIIETVNKNPDKNVFGWVLNLCHKYSSGTHWVAMGLIKQSNTNFLWMYYDSQDTEGPQTGEIYCDFRSKEGLSQQQVEKYSHYQSYFPQWWDQVLSTFSQHGLTMNKTIQHNTFITQKDDFTCGYHAFYFLYLLTTEKEKTINSISLQISSTQSSNLDKFMKQFQQKVFDLSGVK